MEMIDDNEWPDGWEPVEAGAGALFVAQFLAEAGEPDGIEAESLRCVGRFGGSDDMVFAVRGWNAPYFVAHLSWAKADRRNWLVRRLRPWPRLAPVLVPVSAIGDLAGFFK